MDIFTALSWTQWIEFNNLNVVVSPDDVIWKYTRYMLWWVSDNTKRNSDDDIKIKCYFFVDIDIRSEHFSKTWEVLNDEQLNEEINNILVNILQSEYQWFSYAVHSWNWLHLYYLWDEIEIDKTTYSKWVQYFYYLMNSLLSKTWYSCDKACHNIWRISRVPWSINTRRKERWWKLIWDLWNFVCDVLIQKEWDKKIYNSLIEYARKFDEMKVPNVEQKVNTHLLSSKNDDIRKDINNIDILPIVLETRWLNWSKENWDIISLKDNNRNIGAYVYRPKNCVVSTWTTRSKSWKDTFTTYEFVLYEVCNWSHTALIDYFESKHSIKFSKQSKEFLSIEIPDRVYFTNLWYRYWWSIFDDVFENLRSWELCVIASPTNLWKSTFAQKILQRNPDKKSLYLNFEFDLDKWYEDARKRKKWYKVKEKWTDLDPYSEEDKKELELYIDACKRKIEVKNLMQWEKLQVVIDTIVEYMNKWYSLFVIDTFSSIWWADSREQQNMIIRKLHDLTKQTWICLIVVHHYNKTWQKIAWSQKISDLANVVISIEYKDFGNIEWSEFSLLKEKALYWTKKVECIFKDWEYKSAYYI